MAEPAGFPSVTTAPLSESHGTAATWVRLASVPGARDDSGAPKHRAAAREPAWQEARGGVGLRPSRESAPAARSSADEVMRKVNRYKSANCQHLVAPT